MIQISIYEILDGLFAVHRKELHSEWFYYKSFLSADMEWIEQYVRNLQNFANREGVTISVTKKIRRIA